MDSAVCVGNSYPLDSVIYLVDSIIQLSYNRDLLGQQGPADSVGFSLIISEKPTESENSFPDRTLVHF